MLVRACQEVEQRTLEEKGKTVKRQRLEQRQLLTRFGWVRLQRWRVKEGPDHTECPLDGVLSLESRQHVTPWVKERALYFVTQLPFRPSAAIFSEEVGEEVNHRMLWWMAQREGEKIVAKEEEEWKAVFEEGVVPERDEKEREIVVSEVDGIMLKAQGEAEDRFEVRLGVLFSGRELESETAKHKRYRLVERVRYGGVEEAEEFGERLFLRGEKHLGLSRAKHVLLVGDGASWIEPLAGGDRYKAVYQLDWWHLERKIWESFGAKPEVAEHLVGCLRQRRAEEILRAVKLRLALGEGVRERLEDLQGYLEGNWQGLYGVDLLRAHLSAEGQKVLVVGSGAIEKQADLVIKRRMKGQGMRWTKKGANHLLKLRLRFMEGEALAA
ncbi:MAG: UPF0236 family protein [Chloroflexi bacterium]|nr:UPF0236 family protein [Chloroflexota bacterium]